MGVVVLAFAALAARSVALGGFGLDSLIEIGASTVVIWELRGFANERRRRAMRLIGIAFVALAIYLAIQSSVVLVIGFHPRHSPLGIAWTAATGIALFGLAAGKSRVGKILEDPVLTTEARVTFIDGVLASAVLACLLFDALAGWWWSDPVALMSCFTTRQKRGRQLCVTSALHRRIASDTSTHPEQRHLHPRQITANELARANALLGAREALEPVALMLKRPSQTWR